MTKRGFWKGRCRKMRSCVSHGTEVCVPCAVDFEARNALLRNETPKRLLSRDEALAQLTAPGKPLELRERVFVNGPKTMRELFATCATAAPFLLFDDGAQLSFRQTWERACDVANFLLARGVRKGDRVVVSCRNFPEWIIVWSVSEIATPAPVRQNVRAVQGRHPLSGRRHRAALSVRTLRRTKQQGVLAQHVRIAKKNAKQTRADLLIGFDPGGDVSQPRQKTLRTPALVESRCASTARANSSNSATRFSRCLTVMYSAG
jgi:hypothetical protein